MQQVLRFVGRVYTVQYVELRGTAHEGGGYDQSIGSTVSNAIVRSWLWSNGTRSSRLGYFGILLQVKGKSSMGRNLPVENLIQQYVVVNYQLLFFLPLSLPFFSFFFECVCECECDLVFWGSFSLLSSPTFSYVRVGEVAVVVGGCGGTDSGT